MSDFQQFSLVRATFVPQRRDDLREGAAAFIGQRGTWEPSWIIDDGPYEGQWACVLHGEAPQPFVWAPSGDLRDVRVLREGIA